MAAKEGKLIMQPQEKHRPHNRRTLRTTGLLAAALLAPALAAYGALASGTTPPQAAAPATVLVASSQTQMSPPSQSLGSTAAATVYARNEHSVVNITGSSVVQTPFGTMGQQGTGSGFVIDNNGYIATNNHVVQDANELTVTLPDGTTVPAKLVGRDPDTDIAVIKVDPNATDDNGQPIGGRLTPVTLGNSDQIVIGEAAVAMGSPLGLAQTVTEGVVSAIRHPGDQIGPLSSQDQSQSSGQPDAIMLGGAIQTDAAINPGNSGGPLFNAIGEVIGMNQSILSSSGGYQGVGFAIPVNVIKRVVPQLVQQGCYVHPLIGIASLPLNQLGQQTKQRLGVSANQTGLLVEDVSAGAAQAGVKGSTNTVSISGVQVGTGGDIVVGVDNQKITNEGQLRAYIENNTKPGQTVTLTVLRNGQRQNIQVQLSQRPNGQCNGPTTGPSSSTTGNAGG